VGISFICKDHWAMSTFDRIFGGEPSGPKEPREGSWLDNITGKHIWPVAVVFIVLGLGAFFALMPSASSQDNAELELTIQEYCLGDAKWGEAIDARNQLIDNYRAGRATQDDLSIAISNFDCMPESATPLESELGR
jgi:hypothetical protein